MYGTGDSETAHEARLGDKVAQRNEQIDGLRVVTISIEAFGPLPRALCAFAGNRRTRSEDGEVSCAERLEVECEPRHLKGCPFGLCALVNAHPAEHDPRLAIWTRTTSKDDE